MTRSLRNPRVWVLLALVAALAIYWLLPISGTVVILPRPGAQVATPTFRVDPPSPLAGTTASVFVTDVEPWVFVVLTVDGDPADPVGEAVHQGRAWTWQWTFDVPQDGYTLAFYRDCHLGCVRRGTVNLGRTESASAGLAVPTKLGVALPSAQRDWHGRSGWAVEITYALQPETEFWGVDDLAARVVRHHAQGLRVLVRVDYDQAQSIPPVDDYLALTAYLAYLQRLARDDRLQDVYGYIIGSDFNTYDANRGSLARPVDPAWYARVFSGYGEEAARTDNALQTIRAVNPELRVIVGPVQPWSSDQNGVVPHQTNVPWLNYMNTVVFYLDAAARAKAEVGVALALPDGFDVQAPGSPDAPEMAGSLREDEPRLFLPRTEWGGAQVGFQVYRDWMEIINSYSALRGLPIYIVSSNTYDRQAGIPPAQNYPSGWLSAALDVVNAEPQVVALCWFLDEFPHSDQWDWFSLTRGLGRLADAAEEFDRLLQGP